MKISFHVALAFIVLALLGCHGAHDHHADAEPAHEPAPASEVAWSDLLPNARQPLEGVTSGGQPTEEQLAQAAEAGYKTVINLRMPSESGQDGEAQRVADLGMDYIHLPIDGAEGITEENARALHESIHSAQGPVLLHCGSGNRVGALLALCAYHVQGKGADESIQYGLDSGLTSLEPVVRDRLGATNRE